MIAAHSENIARLLEQRVYPFCERLGLSLQTGSVSNRLSFSCSEELIEFLADQDPLLLLDTCLVLHVGPDIEECFSSGITYGDSPWHRSSRKRPGVALEISLRFPQLFVAYVIPGGFNGSEGLANNEFHKWKCALEADAQDCLCCVPNLNRNWEALHFASSTDASLRDLRLILERFAAGFRTLYDPSGIRSLLRNRFLAQIFGSRTKASGGWQNTALQRAVLLARLQHYLVAIDEELDVTLLTGYAAYKFGYRTWMVNTFSDFNQTMNPAWWDIPEKRVIRDVDLRFPDFPQDEHIREELTNIGSSFWEDKLTGFADGRVIRSSVVRVLTQSRNVDATPPRGAAATPDHGQYDRQQSGRPEVARRFIGIPKPLPSLYAILNLLSLSNESRTSIVSRLAPVAIGGHWTSHGAPYANLRIASHLLSDATRCRPQGDMRHAILSALLAQEALSLLLGMSRNVALDALRELHLSEASVESSCTGLAHSIHIHDRQRDLGEAATKLLGTPHSHNFLSRVWAELRYVYREGEQFLAAEEANAESLAYERKSRLSNHAMRFALSWIQSLPRLTVLFLVWSAVLSTFYALAGKWELSISPSGFANVSRLYMEVIKAICRASPLDTQGLPGLTPSGTWFGVADLLAAVSSLFIVGLLVSVLFRRLTRG